MSRLKQKLIASAALLLVIIIGGCSAWLYYKYREKENPASNNQIIKYELQTSEVFDSPSNNSKYRITSTKELNDFYSKYSDVLNVNAKYLKYNDIFIQVKSEPSSSISHKLEDVDLENNTVNFIISTDEPSLKMADMAFWYFVAVIPRSQLNNLDLSSWETP